MDRPRCFLLVLGLATWGACASHVAVESASSAAASSTGATGASTGAGGAATGGASSSSAAAGPGGAASSGASSASSSAASGGSGGSGGSEIVRLCTGHIYACGDAIDNDGDSLVDAEDPDCTGPCDNTEDSYDIKVPGHIWAPCTRDCAWDQDSGSGNDDCRWSHTCDPHEVAPDYSPEGATCAYDPQQPLPGTNATCADLYAAQSAMCTAYCVPLTPNGCDCFGCCELPAQSGNFVWLSSTDANLTPTCDQASVLDPTKCHPCEPVPSCWNACDNCELCLGKPSLPPGCGVQQCGGAAPCGLAGQPSCPAGFYCITGCCQVLP
jgi:hypothetical protein